jgi:hypothetical protein
LRTFLILCHFSKHTTTYLRQSDTHRFSHKERQEERKVEMEVLTVSQKTLTELSSLENISTEEVTKLCKYFLQAIIRGQVINEIGRS